MTYHAAATSQPVALYGQDSVHGCECACACMSMCGLWHNEDACPSSACGFRFVHCIASAPGSWASSWPVAPGARPAQRSQPLRHTSTACWMHSEGYVRTVHCVTCVGLADCPYRSGGREARVARDRQSLDPPTRAALHRVTVNFRGLAAAAVPPLPEPVAASAQPSEQLGSDPLWHRRRWRTCCWVHWRRARLRDRRSMSGTPRFGRSTWPRRQRRGRTCSRCSPRRARPGRSWRRGRPPSS